MADSPLNTGLEASGKHNKLGIYAYGKGSKFCNNGLTTCFVPTVATLLTLLLMPTFSFERLIATLMPGPSSTLDISQDIGSAVAVTLCPQVEPLDIGRHTVLYEEMMALYENAKYKKWAYESLSGAIRIPYV